MSDMVKLHLAKSYRYPFYHMHLNVLTSPVHATIECLLELGLKYSTISHGPL